MAPALEDIESGLAALNLLREKPAGTIHITAHDHAVQSVLWPALLRLLPNHPDITIEIIIDYGLTDIVAERFDAGIRAGEMVAKDMIALRIGPDLRMAVVAAPTYFAQHPPPTTPQDLTAHRCINLRLPTHGALYAWEFTKQGRDIRVHVQGPPTVNLPEPAAAHAGVCFTGGGAAGGG